MSVYIKGFPLPNNCGACPLRLVWCRERIYMVTRPERCPLISVPPHGDLIDRDALAKMCQEMQSVEWNNKAAPYSWAYAYESFESDIDNAPTIIGAEPCNDLAKPNNAADYPPSIPLKQVWTELFGEDGE